MNFHKMYKTIPVLSLLLLMQMHSQVGVEADNSFWCYMLAPCQPYGQYWDWWGYCCANYGWIMFYKCNELRTKWGAYNYVNFPYPWIVGSYPCEFHGLPFPKKKKR